MLGELFHIEKILEVCEKILYFLKINLLFLVFNIPVLLFFLFVGISNVREYLPFFLLCLRQAPGKTTGPDMYRIFRKSWRWRRSSQC